MIWQEQRIRDDIIRKSSIPDSDASELVDEIDRLRSALRRIKDQAQSHVDDKAPGWGRWAATLRLVKEVLEVE